MAATDAQKSSAATVAALRALEALRAGLPNRESVLYLGTMQDQVVDKYLANLEFTKRRANWEPVEGVYDGLLLASGFGSGKSHLLEYLAQRALQEHFVVSSVVISKETPLHNISAVYRAAINDARVQAGPGRPSAKSLWASRRTHSGSLSSTDGWPRTAGSSTTGSPRRC
ncbi:MAG: ATP-binding protein [Actinobacteria bacterium]|nr:ATP-binding protein [Actinomycetota bacterium]